MTLCSLHFLLVTTEWIYEISWILPQTNYITAGNVMSTLADDCRFTGTILCMITKNVIAISLLLLLLLVWQAPLGCVAPNADSYDTPGICLIWHSCNVAEQRKMPCLDSSQQAWLPCCPSHLDIPHWVSVNTALAHQPKYYIGGISLLTAADI